MRFVHFLCIFCFLPIVTPKKLCNFGHSQQITSLLMANKNLETDLKILKKDYERNITDLEKDYKRNISDLETKYQKKISDLENQLASSKNKSRGTDAVLIVRHDLEEIDGMIEVDVIYASKNTMLAALKNIKGRKNYLSDIDLKEVAGIVLQPYVDIRYVRWLYYLAFHDEPMANKIRGLLRENNVHITAFCKLIGDIFANVSGIIHHYSENVSTDDILEGLHYFNIQTRSILQAVQLLRELRKVNVLWEGEMSTIDFSKYDKQSSMPKPSSVA